MAEKKSGKKERESEDRKLKKSEEKKREKVINEVEENIEKSEEKEEEKEDAHPDRKQVLHENKTLAIFLGILLLLIGVFVAYLSFSNNASSFTYGGMKYTIVHQGKLTFYKTEIPIVENGTKVPYKFYIRNDPRTLNETVPFNGSLYIRPAMNINYSNDIQCNGDGTIAVANLVNLYTVLGTKVVRDPNATCDLQQRYVDVNIKLANETSVVETAPACYTINVANCQILPATERFMTETFTTIKPYFYNSS